MSWFATLLIVSILIAFNAFAADTMVRLKHDVKDIHKAVLVLTDKLQAADTKLQAANTKLQAADTKMPGATTKTKK